MANDDNTKQPRLPLKDVPLELQERIVDLGGNPRRNVHKILSHNPKLLSSFVEFGYSLRDDCTSSRQLRELIILRGAQLSNSQYQWYQHEKMAKQCGVSDEQINSLKNWHQSSLFNEKEKVALELMEILIEHGGKVDDRLDEQLKKHFTEAEYVELVMTGSFYAVVPSMLEALQVPIEQ